MPIRVINFPDWLGRVCICSKALLCNIVSCPPLSGEVGCVEDALKSEATLCLPSRMIWISNPRICTLKVAEMEHGGYSSS